MKATLSDLTAFAAIARHGSFRKAADELSVSRSSLSHALRGLETELGVRLLHRTTRSVATTQAGARLLARLDPALRDLDDMLAAVRNEGAELVGMVRINALEVATRWLMQRVVPVFLASHPRVELDLVSENRLVDIVANGFDAGVRLRESVPQDMIAAPFGGPVRFLAVASPVYLAEHGTPATPDDLRRHRCIRQRLPSGKIYRWEFARGRDEVTIDVPGALILDDNIIMAEAAVDNVGIAFLPEMVVRDALADGQLTALLEEWSPDIEGLCIYYPGNRHVPPALQAFIDAVRAIDAS